MKNVRAELGKHFALGFFLVFLDQLLKFLVFRGWRFDGGFFEVTFVKNTGAGFGIFQGANVTLIIVSLVVLGIILYSWQRSKDRVFLTLIVSGILGNLADRIRLGYVVDWFNLGWFPVFNVADSCITIGVLGFILLSLKRDLVGKKKKKVRRPTRS